MSTFQVGDHVVLVSSGVKRKAKWFVFLRNEGKGTCQLRYIVKGLDRQREHDRAHDAESNVKRYGKNVYCENGFFSMDEIAPRLTKDNTPAFYGFIRLADTQNAVDDYPGPHAVFHKQRAQGGGPLCMKASKAVTFYVSSDEEVQRWPHKMCRNCERIHAVRDRKY